MEKSQLLVLLLEHARLGLDYVILLVLKIEQCLLDLKIEQRRKE